MSTNYLFMPQFNAPAYNIINDSTGLMSLCNAQMADSIARNMMYTINPLGGGLPLNPAMFDSWTYGSIMNITMGQAYQRGQLSWNADTQSFSPQFGNFGWGMGAGMMGWQGGQFPGLGGSTGNGGGSSTTDPDKAKYNKLLGLMKQLNTYANDKSSHILTSSQKTKLAELIKKSYSADNYTALKEFYNSLSKEDIKKFVKYGATTLALEGDVNKVDAKADSSVRYYLEEIGFECEPEAAVKAVNEFDNHIGEISKENSNSDIIFGYINNYPALEIISRWNTKHKSSSSKGIAEKCVDVYKKAGNKSDVIIGIKGLVDNLTTQAGKLAKEIGGDTETAIEDAIAKLNDSITDTKLETDFVSKFNNLYILARLTAAKLAANSLVGRYGDIDSQVFTQDMFTEDTITDLKAEGQALSTINTLNKKVKIPESDRAVVESPAAETPAEETPADETPADETPTEETPTEESPEAAGPEGLSEDAKVEAKELGEDYGTRLFEALDGTNGCAFLGGFDFWGIAGNDGHENANNIMNRINNDTNPLVVATLIQKFNEQSGFSENKSNQRGIFQFIMDESWSGEEAAVQKLAIKVLEMCEILKGKGLLTLTSLDKEAYDMLQSVKSDADKMEEYDNDSENMIIIDKFASKVCELYIENFG